MAKNTLTKYELKSKIFRLINELPSDSCSDEAKNVAKKYLDEVVFTILLDSL